MHLDVHYFSIIHIFKKVVILKFITLVVEIHNVDDEDANTAILSFHEEYESEDGLGNTRYKKVLNEVDESTHKFDNNLKASGMKEMDSYAEDSDSDKTRGTIAQSVYK